MSRDLATLRNWAEDRAFTDDDHAARPLWAQIAAEVANYLDSDDRTPGTDDVPLFGDATPTPSGGGE